MPRLCLILSMSAGVRLIQKSPKRGTAPSFAVTTLRNASRPTFTDLCEARRAFKAEVEVSRCDPRVGPYVS